LFGFWLWSKAARRPVDTTAMLVAVAATLMIVVNAVYLQTGSRPAPYFANLPPATPARAPETHPASAQQPATRPAGAARSTPAAAVRVNDPIAAFIESSSRVMAVQRVLSEYGYGQIDPTGMLDDPTKSAIERFEREHALPVTGQVSDGLMSAVSAMTGHPLQ
jgi:hypothetical protein